MRGHEPAMRPPNPPSPERSAEGRRRSAEEARSDRPAGATVYGVALPGHFVVGFGPQEQQVLADPFDGGRVLSGRDAEVLVAGATGAGLHPSMLTPADPLDVVLRILNNIRAWAATRPER